MKRKAPPSDHTRRVTFSLEAPAEASFNIYDGLSSEAEKKRLKRELFYSREEYAKILCDQSDTTCHRGLEWLLGSTGRQQFQERRKHRSAVLQEQARQRLVGGVCDPLSLKEVSLHFSLCSSTRALALGELDELNAMEAAGQSFSGMCADLLMPHVSRRTSLLGMPKADVDVFKLPNSKEDSGWRGPAELAHVGSTARRHGSRRVAALWQ